MLGESFVYVWTNIENNKLYIGKHKGSTDDGYISSGKAFLAIYDSCPDKFVRDIVFRGTDSECLKEETKRIRDAVGAVGWSGIYNLTSWSHLSQWSRTCLHCGARCCPENADWAQAFEEVHFNNCSKKPCDHQAISNNSGRQPSSKKVVSEKAAPTKRRNRRELPVKELMDRIYQKKRERLARRS